MSFRKLITHGKAIVGITLLGLVILGCVLAPFLTKYGPTELNLSKRLQPPFSEGGQGLHLLGTDSLGRDILSRILFGARVSLMVAVPSVLISASIGIILGLLAGYKGGVTESIIMRGADLQSAFPVMIFAIMAVAALGPNLRNTIIALGIAGWPIHARIIRGETLSVKESDFVLAGKAVGALDARIIRSYIIPNVMSPEIVVISFQIAQMIIAESALSFLGIGVQPPTPSWGVMLSDARDYVFLAWWPATFPGLAIMSAVMGINLVGDWLRDVLDPRLR